MILSIDYPVISCYINIKVIEYMLYNIIKGEL
jgi:hypothetical protein